MLKLTAIEQKATFFRELATLVGAGVTIGVALDTLREQVPPGRLRMAVIEAAHQAKGGRPFSEAMTRYSDVFTPVETALIRVGEQAGHLDRLLAQIASYLEQEYSLRQMINRETFYPKIIFAAIIAFPIVVPAIIAALVTGPGAGFLVLFRGLLRLGLLVALALGAYALLRYMITSNSSFAASYDSFKLNVPVLGAVVRRLALARFCRGLATLYGAGVGLPEAVSLSADLTGNAAMRGPMHAAAVKLEEGSSVSEVLAEVPYMDDVALRMLRTGETTGSVDEMMLRVAEHFEEASGSSIKRMATLITPIATIIAGIIVLFMALGVYGGIIGAALSY
jgi:type II secretory pathway component PulF